MSEKKEDFMTSKWRPLMAMTYMATIWFDFIIGPILYNLLQYWNPGQAVTAYQPITLQGGGLYHLAMGAVLGISAFTRGQEKIAAINNPPPPEPVMNLPVAQAAPAPVVDTTSPPPAFGEPPATATPVVNTVRTTPTRKIV